MKERQPGLKKSVVLRAITQALQNMDASHFEDGFPPELAVYKKDAEELGMRPPIRDADQRSSYGYARVMEWEKE